MTDFAHLLGVPLLLLYLAHEWRAWRRHTAAPEVMAARPQTKNYVLRWDANGIERGDWGE